MEDDKDTSNVCENVNKSNEVSEDTVEKDVSVDESKSVDNLECKDEEEVEMDKLKEDNEEVINEIGECKEESEVNTEENEKQSKEVVEQSETDSRPFTVSKDPLNQDTDTIEESESGSKSPKLESTDNTEDAESHTEPQITTESIPVGNEESSMNDVEMEDLEIKENLNTEQEEAPESEAKLNIETQDEPMDVDETDKPAQTQASDDLFNDLKNTPNITNKKSLVDAPTVQIPDFDKSIKDASEDTTDSFHDAADDLSNDNADDSGEKITENTENQGDVPEEGAIEEGVCDLEEGKGVDEAICLLPDSEIEITDADKERAILAREAAENSEHNKIIEDNNATPVQEQTRSNSESTVELYEENITEGNDVSTEAIDQDCGDTEEQINVPKENEFIELVGESKEIECMECKVKKLCEFSVIENNETNFVCGIKCVESLQAKNTDKYTLKMKKVIISLILDTEQKCAHCNDYKMCKFRFIETLTDYKYLCSESCITNYIGPKKQKYLVKRKRYLIEDLKTTDTEYKCLQCTETKICKYICKQDEDLYICDDNCYNLLLKEQPGRFRTTKQLVRVRDLPLRTASLQTPQETDTTKMVARSDEDALVAQNNRDDSFVRKCVQCYSEIEISEKSLYWETQDYCNEICLGQYQHAIGSVCTTCHKNVSLACLGKYCVRFGYDIKQFCRSLCLDQYKKGLKVCSFCQNDISGSKNGFLAPVGDKGQFKDFCSQKCLKDYEDLSCPKKRGFVSTCAVCNNKKITKLEVVLDEKSHRFCSNPCFSAFKFVNNVFPDQCGMCTKYFERKIEHFTIYEDGKPPTLFCSKICMNVYIITNRQIVPCNWCKVKKYNFDMIQKIAGDISMLFCSINCLTLCEVSTTALSTVRNPCDQCKMLTKPQYHLTMSDGSLRNFCTYQCVMAFQSQFGKTPLTLESEDGVTVVPTGLPKRIRKDPSLISLTKTLAPLVVQSSAKIQAIQSIPIITNVQSLAASSTTTTPTTRNLRKSKQKEIVIKKMPPPPVTRRTVAVLSPVPTQQIPNPQFIQPSPPPPPPPVLVAPPKIEYKTQVITIPATPSSVGNIATMCKPDVQSKGVSCRPKMCTVECQTDDYLQRKIVIPIPVPIYVPVPMHMFSMPVPTPVPMPLPIPVPIFIPTTRNSATGIMKEIKKIQDKMPTDPFEAELLMMAEMVAGEKKKNESDSSDEEAVVEFATETIESHNAFGEDMLQMALKMATEYEEPAVDLESAMTANTITPNTHPNMPSDESTDEPTSMHHHHHMMLLEQSRAQPMQRGRKRGASQNASRGRNSIVNNQSPKRPRRSDLPVIQVEPEETREPAEKPDAHLCLKFTFGVNAWKQWVMTKNADLEKSTIRRKPFKSDLLQLTADELNYSLCMFVKEVRKPNGSDYAPDTIYYLVLGIQEFLYENSRIDNIFTDPYYEKFTDCLDEVAKKFSVLYNDSQYIVTRVEEEHLWECKQLGAHSPHVLLSTLMFFNTKHFNLTSVEEHMQLSFSHIMKHWKRNPNQPGAAKIPGSRNVLLRFYPPQTSIENSRKKKVYEQQENEENPLRCPVKLYEFYLSKCPESVKTRNDVFYLQPERSCVPDSPVWYSTQALSREALSKMLHRVKMVKEINIALLTS